MKKKWQETPLASRIGFILEMLAVILTIVFLAMGMRVPTILLNLYLIGMIMVLFGTYGKRRR